jgi:hypothetical protein
MQGVHILRNEAYGQYGGMAKNGHNAADGLLAKPLI